MATGTAMPDDLHLMAIAAAAMSRDRLYGVSLEEAHLILKNNWAATRLAPCCVDAEQRMMGRVEVVVSSISAIFDNHIRFLFEYNQLAYNPLPPMMDLVKASMASIPSISSSTVAAAKSEVPIPKV